MKKHQIQEAIHGNNLLWRCVFTDELVTSPLYDLTYTFGVDSKFMSSAQRLNLDSETELKKELEKIEAHYAIRNKPSSIYLDPATEPKNLKQKLIDRGYKEEKSEEEVWWGFNLSKKINTKTAPGLKIVECTTRKLFEDHLQAAMKGYKHFKFWASLMSKLFRHSLDGVDVIHYVGYIESEPVACSSLGIYQNYAYLINTAVVPEHRRKGIHTSLMTHRLNVAKQRNCTLAFYQTDFDNEASIGTGKKVGFTEAFRRNLYYLDK